MCHLAGQHPYGRGGAVSLESVRFTACSSHFTWLGWLGSLCRTWRPPPGVVSLWTLTILDNDAEYGEMHAFWSLTIKIWTFLPAISVICYICFPLLCSFTSTSVAAISVLQCRTAVYTWSLLWAAAPPARAQEKEV